jgi:PhoH-like ATPase
MTKLYVVDTNVLLNNATVIEEYNIVILSHVLRELEKHKLSKNQDLAYCARESTRYIFENKDKFKFDLIDYQALKGYDSSYEDNKIINACITNDYGLITSDMLLQLKAEGFGIETVDINPKVDDNGYAGVKDIYIDPSNQEDANLLSNIYSLPQYNSLALVENEYVVFWDKTKPKYNEDNKLIGHEFIDKFKWANAKDGYMYVKPRFKKIDNYSLGKISPINIKQELLFDLLQNNSMTVKTCFGGFGVGKDFCMISHAVDMLENPKSNISKILWVRNNIDLKDSEPIGFLPGDKNEKLMEFAMPLADHVGGVEAVMQMIRSEQVEIQHLGTLRGRDLKDTIIYVTECQNNTKEHIKLLLGRIGQGSQLWLNGDIEQTDRDKFIRNSGLNSLKKLKGNKLFGLVTLDKIERSETASLVELLD